MKIKNPALAGATLAVGGEEITGDEQGVFEVSEKVGKALITTPGWLPLKKGKAPEAAPEPPPEPAAEEATEEPVEEEPEEVDLDSLTKAQLIELAEEQGVEIDPYDRKDEIKAALEEALGGG